MAWWSDPLARWQARRAPDAAAPAEHARLARALLQATAHALAQRQEGDAVIQTYCDALAGASEHLLAAWTWFGEPDPPAIVPQVVAGRMAQYGRSLVIDRTWLTDRGPAYRTLRGAQVGPFNIDRLALYPAWRVAAGDYGIRSVLCVPIPSAKPGHAGLFALYADTPGYFDPTLVDLARATGELFGTLLTHALDVRLLREAVQTDPLTGLGNRRALERFAEIHRQHGPEGAPLALLMVDLDHFKHVNDAYGHAVGDQVLRQVSEVLRTVGRQRDFVGRLGGEEFVMCLADTDLRGAQELAERVRQALGAAAHDSGQGQCFRVSGSIGLVLWQPGESLESALARADAALYEAKRRGRDQVALAAEPAAF